ncbi:MAG: efflux RND transporter periplasmic adaptor subunit [Gammaproteobacteria bacterium]
MWATEPLPLSGFDCLIEPHAVIEVSTREEGILSARLVERGELVKADQTLAQLESEMEKVAVALARARSNMRPVIEEREASKAFAERQSARVAELYRKRAIPFDEKDRADTEVVRAAMQLRQAHNDFLVAELELRRAQTALDQRTIRSPVNGVVAEWLLSAGESVEDRPIVRVAEIDPLNVEIIVPVERYGEIEPGMKAQVTPLVPGASTRVATVEVVDRVVDAASGTFGVRLELSNADHRLPGGLRCEISFVP